MNWINALEKLPDENAEKNIYAARWMADRETNDILAYEEMCMLGDGKIRIGNNTFKAGQAILTNVDWLDESSTCR